MPVGGLAGVISEKERFLNEQSKDTVMQKEAGVRPSGLSMLTSEELINFQGQCLGIVDGKVKIADKDADKVLRELIQLKSADKVFTCVPNVKATLVK